MPIKNEKAYPKDKSEHKKGISFSFYHAVVFSC